MEPLQIIAMLVCGAPLVLLLVIWFLALRENNTLNAARKQGANHD